MLQIDWVRHHGFYLKYRYDIMAPKVAYVIRNGGGECSFSRVRLWEHYLGNKAEFNSVQFTLFVSCWSKTCHIQLLIKYFSIKMLFFKVNSTYGGVWVFLFWVHPSLCTTYWARREGWNAPSYVHLILRRNHGDMDWY